MHVFAMMHSINVLVQQFFYYYYYFMNFITLDTSVSSSLSPSLSHSELELGFVWLKTILVFGLQVHKKKVVCL